MKLPKTQRVRKTRRGKVKEFKIQFWFTEKSIDDLMDLYPEYNTLAPLGNRMVSDCKELDSIRKKERQAEENKKDRGTE
ncbi:MAG TPA: hypothetical protein VMZ04_06310 [Anaerolineae bacterium]|nr:hypothetical protein [Anaerolineae bacterium]